MGAKTEALAKQFEGKPGTPWRRWKKLGDRTGRR